MANRYSVKSGLDERGMAGLAGISKIGDRYRQNKQQEELGASVSEALKAGNYEKLTELSVKHPQLSSVLNNLAGFKSDKTRQFYGEGLDSTLTSMEGMQTQDAEGNMAFPEMMIEEMDISGENPTGSMIQDPQYAEQSSAMNQQLEDTAVRIEKAGGSPQHIREAQKLLADGDIKGAYAQARTGLQMGNPELSASRYGSSSSTDTDPAMVKEHKYFLGLNDSGKNEYRSLKRKGWDIKDIGGVPTMVNTNTPIGGDPVTIPLSDLGTEQEANTGLSGATQEGIEAVKSKWTEFNKLRDTEGGRHAGRKKAEYFYDLFDAGKMSSGGMRKFLSYIPFTFTEQGELDEEFNAFAETSARQALKESGEIRPTDADVKGMKQAMFGIGRAEPVNKRLLKQFMNSIDRNDHKAYLAGQATKFRKDNPTAKSRGGILNTDASGNQAYVFPDGTFEEVYK